MNIMPYVGVINKDDKKIGSGFVIDPENRLLVTARHVISEYQPDLDASLDGFSFEFFESHEKISIKSQVSGAPREHEDIVILELADNLPKGLLSPRLISYVKPSDDVYVVGYVDDERKGEHWDYKSAQGKLSGYTVRNKTQVIQLDIDGIYAGMSGAPVMLGDKGIIGVLTHQVSEASNQTALVTPIEFVANIDNRISTPRRKYLEILLKELSEIKTPVEFPEYLPIAAIVTPSPNDNNREFFTDIFQIAEQHNKINFVGAAGSGKTTALQQLALRIGKQALDNPQSPIPVWINLSVWAINPNQYFSDFIEGYINRTSYKSIKDFYPLEDLISDNKIIFFFDEFDQVTENFKDFRDWVHKTNVSVYTSCRDTYFSKSRQLDIPTAFLEPLQTVDIFNFAKTFLDDKQHAEEFVSLIAPDVNIEDKQAALSQVASNPLFLALMLRDYKENRYWKTSKQETVIPTLWTLFENIIVSLWESPRIQDTINQSHFLELQFADARGIIQKLSEVAQQVHRNSFLDQKNLENHFPKEIIEAFLDAHILKVDTSTRSYQFIHSLFVDFLVANHINLNEIDMLIKKPEWLSPLFILATRSNDERKFIQTALLKFANEENEFHTNKFSSSIAIQILGNLGDDVALDSLITLYGLRPEKTGILKPIAKIANRLHYQNKERIKAIGLLKTIMFSPKWMMGENNDASAGNFYELDWFWGDYVTATEAMSYIKSPDALEAILDVLEKSAHFFEDKFMSGDFMRQEWFSQYLSGMGEWAIPRLLDALDSEHSHITVTIAKALLRINRPLDLDIIGKLALTHPNPMVRAQLALTLGKIRTLDSIPYLEKMLLDVEIWSTLGIGMQRHYFVADYAANSLAYIRKPDAVNVLRNNNYTADGSPTTDLLLERITCGISVNNRFPLQTQVATTLLHRGEIAKLLPLMGHVHVYQLWEYFPMCPVAKAIVDYCSETKDVLSVTRCIIKYLENSADTQSCKWTLVILGYVGDAAAMPLLRKYLDSKISQISDAAAYGLGVFVSRNITNSHNVHDVMVLIRSLGDKLSSLTPEGYMGIGLGLSKIIKSSSVREKDYPDAIILIRDLLLDALNAETKQERIVSLDALETICIENPDFITDEIALVVKSSPSYYLKEAHRLHENEKFSEMHPILRSRVDYTDAMAMYKLVFSKNNSNKNNDRNEKLVGINWDDLNIHWGYLHSQIAKIYIVDENWDQAYDAFLQAVKFLDTKEPSPFNRYLRIYVYSELGNLLCRFLNRPEDALPYFDLALSEFKLLPEQETRNADLLSVFCNAMLNNQNLLVERQESSKIIQLGQDVKHLLGNTSYFSDDDLAIIFMSTAVELTRQYQFGDALEYTEIAYARLRKSANWKLKISSLLKIAELRHAIDKAEDVEPIILEARNIARKHDDTLSEAFCLRDLAHNTDLEKDTKKAISYYENALSLFGNANEEKLLEEKAGIYHELAVLYQKQGDYEKSEETFLKAIDHVKKITPVFPNMPYVIQSEYAKLLSATGRHHQAIEFLLSLSQEMLAKGLTPGIVGQTLHEIDTPQGHQMPFSAAERWASSLVKIGSGEIDRDDYEQKLQTVFGEVVRQGLHAESDFFSGLLDILHDNDNVTLTDENPYFEFYRSAKEQFSVINTDNMDINLSEIEMHLREGNFENAGILYFGLAQKLLFEDDMDNALETAQMALDCFRKSGTQELIGGTLGFMYTIQMQKTNRYINDLTESIQGLEREGNFEIAHQQRFELAKALADKGDYDSALSQANDIRMYYEKTGNIDSVQRTIVLIATIQSIMDVREGDLDEVDAKIKKYILENDFLSAGMLRLTLASSLANDAKYETARKYIEAANLDFEQIGYSEGQWMAHEYLDKINKLTG